MKKQNAVVVKVLDDLLELAKVQKDLNGKLLESHDNGDGLLKAYHQALNTVIYLKKELMERHSTSTDKVIHLFPPNLPAA
jgi:hypothetical protein